MSQVIVCDVAIQNGKFREESCAGIVFDDPKDLLMYASSLVEWAMIDMGYDILPLTSHVSFVLTRFEDVATARAISDENLMLHNEGEAIGWGWTEITVNRKGKRHGE